MVLICFSFFFYHHRHCDMCFIRQYSTNKKQTKKTFIAHYIKPDSFFLPRLHHYPLAQHSNSNLYTVIFFGTKLYSEIFRLMQTIPFRVKIFSQSSSFLMKTPEQFTQNDKRSQFIYKKNKSNFA